ncbi:glycosyltransferase [Pseudooceanicola sp. CBS1P-1]|uniref:Glycosyltransferase n=1 Tax=Pseudooceanicola albus TaxID=2692189 RepID=A0A6L7GBS6_9RHOB|nr:MULTISPECIES: glycosyltransferase [Pseudooceanicola]MBT9386741.1 glycosyltransferase [Pseudooceanicola endophyticus]MXN20776.1 glycosyltransferase [Pseudooceanicola albus]
MTRSLKIAIQCFNYAPHTLGGSERSARDLAQGFKARGHQVRVVLSDGSKPYPESLDDIPIDIVEGLPVGKSPLHGGERSFPSRMAWIMRSETDPVLLARALAYLRRTRPDIMVMNNPAGHGSAMMAAARMTGTPVVPIIRDYGWYCAFGVMMRGTQPCEGLCKPCRTFSAGRRKLLRGLPKVVAISEHVARLTREVLGTDNTHVIYNAVPDVFLDTPRPETPREGPLAFGYLGRLHPTKGVTELIEAWQASGLAAAGHRLRLAGDNLGVKLPEDPAAHGIDVLGRQEAIPFLDSLDVMFLPALWHEPFGRSVVEALARGLFVVGSPMGGIPELIPPERGMIPERIDVPSLISVMQSIAADPARVRQTRATDPVPALARFRSERMISEYEALLLSLARQKEDVHA